MSVQCNLQTWLDYVGSHSKGPSRKECITEFCHLLVYTHISAGYTSRTVFATCCLVRTRVWTVGFPVSPISSKRRRVLGQRREHHLKPVIAGTVSLRYSLILGSFSIFLARSAQVPPRAPVHAAALRTQNCVVIIPHSCTFVGYYCLYHTV